MSALIPSSKRDVSFRGKASLVSMSDQAEWCLEKLSSESPASWCDFRGSSRG